MTAALAAPSVGNWSWLASNAVSCPKCKSGPGERCTSTGGGNWAVVSTHKARRVRVAGWSQEFANRAGWVARSYQYRNGQEWPDDAFAEFEAAAAPVVEKATKRPTPKGVRLSETQAEYIEHAVLAGGYLSAPLSHFHGEAQVRQTINALEAKGIVVEVAKSPCGYERSLKLTEFGWAVYDQHRLIIKRLTDEQVAEQVARAESGRCLSCGRQPGATQDCDSCDLARFIKAEDARKAVQA